MPPILAWKVHVSGITTSHVPSLNSMKASHVCPEKDMVPSALSMVVRVVPTVWMLMGLEGGEVDVHNDMKE